MSIGPRRTRKPNIPSTRYRAQTSSRCHRTASSPNLHILRAVSRDKVHRKGRRTIVNSIVRQRPKSAISRAATLGSRKTNATSTLAGRFGTCVPAATAARTTSAGQRLTKPTTSRACRSPILARRRDAGSVKLATTWCGERIRGQNVFKKPRPITESYTAGWGRVHEVH